MKVLICDPIDTNSLEQLKQIPSVEVEVKTGLTPQELKEIIGEYEVIVVRSATKVKREVIESARNLKLIIRGGVGVDNIDVEAASEAGIEVRNTPAASSISVAELALGMMFALLRKIPQTDHALKQGKWVKKEYKGIELWGKTLGVVGFGRIGRAVAERAMGLGMNILYYDVITLPPISAPPGVTIKQVSMEELLKKSDIITLHIPYDPKKGAVIGKKELELVKDGVYIINCARGGVVEESALIEALKSGKVAGAGLDVFESEPNFNPAFREIENVVLTPHIGASTKEGQKRVGGEVVNIIREFSK